MTRSRPEFRSISAFPKALCLVPYYSHCTPPLSARAFEVSPSHIICTPTIVNFIFFSSADSASSLNSLKCCLDSVLEWMLSNKLKLNPGKTEFILIGHEKQRRQYLDTNFLYPLWVLRPNHRRLAPARNLGVVFDLDFKFRKHINFLMCVVPVSITSATYVVYVGT